MPLILLVGHAACGKPTAASSAAAAQVNSSPEPVDHDQEQAAWLEVAGPGTVLYYPPDWTTLDRGFAVRATTGPNDGANCNVMVGKAPTEADHEALLEWLDNELSTEHFTRVIERWSPTVSGLEGRALLADYDQKRPEGVAKTRAVQVHAPRSGRLYQLTCTSHRSTFELRRAVFDDIIERWQVDD